ncbi:MAG: hypothetical protein JST80_02835 [Bdellovibrionales bacterium]|nr:hypothetical protein [Bdellovibrionales bacterium]
MQTTYLNPVKLFVSVFYLNCVLLTAGTHAVAHANSFDEIIAASEKLEHSTTDESWNLKIDGLKPIGDVPSERPASKLELEFSSQYFLHSFSEVYAPTNESLRILLDHSQKKLFFGASATYRLNAGHAFSLQGFFYAHSGSSIPQNNTMIKQNLFVLGTPVEQQIEIFNYRLAYHYQFKQMTRSRYSLGFGIDTALLKLNLRQTVNQVSESYFQFIPILCAQADISLTERFLLKNAFSGGYFGKHKSLFDFTMKLAYDLHLVRDDFSFVRLGFRYLDYQIRNDVIATHVSSLGLVADLQFNFL